jgi:poly(A) polymerase
MTLEEKDITIQNSFTRKDGVWKSDEISDNTFIPKVELKIATFNILNDVKSKPVELILRSKSRFAHQLEEIFPRLDADILCLNEVTPLFYDMLLQSNWANQGDLHFSFTGPKESTHENLIITKFPFQVVQMQGGNRRIVLALFPNKERSFLLFSLHLIAFEELYPYRQKQMQIIRKMTTGLKNISEKIQWHNLRHATQNDNVIVLGDLNLHLKPETSIIYDNGFIDLWHEVRPQDVGYTWDPQVNSMIGKFLIFDNRRMRLDRICMSANSQHLIIRDISIFANQPIKSRWWLFPSDHYGLVSTFEVKHDASPYVAKYKYSSNGDGGAVSMKTGFRSMRTIKLMRTALMVAILIIGFFIFFVFSKTLMNMS